MAENIAFQNNLDIKADAVAMQGDQMVNMATFHRKGYERKWYDANFFDDGYHFRYVSRSTGKVIDLNDAGSINTPQRAIPKASRQIRGIVNLLMAPKYVPVMYPEEISKYDYEDPAEYAQAYAQAKKYAQHAGTWMEEEWRNQYMKTKLVQMGILTAKHSVSYMKIWPDAENEKIITTVKDAFDLYLMGNLDNVEDSPFVIEAIPRLVDDIKADPRFDEMQKLRINPENKYAESLIKQAYMQTRFGTGQWADTATTVIQKEAFVKVKLTKDNIEEIMRKTKDPDILAGKRMGQTVMHHFFWAAGTWLLDEYLDLNEYPYVALQFEPGPLYSRALIDMFIPANKSLDIIVSRLEKWANTMVTGIYMSRKGENFEVTNIPGGQKIEYTTTPPTQMQMANIPPAVFNLIGFFNQTIEEQGASTAALGQIPQGVKSGVAIESLKSTEYANLEIAAEQLKCTVEKISKKMLYIADNYFMKPQSVAVMKNGEASYFNIMGKRGMDIRNQLAEQTGLDAGIPNNTTPISSDYKVRVEVESGLGFTMEGKKQTMQQIITFMVQLAEKGLLTTDAVKVVVQRFLEVYQFGSTQEFMEAMETGMPTIPLTEDQISQMKIAMVEALKDTGVIGPQADAKLVDSTKVGTVEALKDTGLINKQKQETDKGPSRSISFKDLPPEGQSQLAAQAGIVLSPEEIEEHQEEQQEISNQGSEE